MSLPQKQKDTIREELIDKICSVRKGSMDDKQFKATVKHILDQAYQDGYTKCWDGFKDMSPYEIGYKQGAKDKVEEVRGEMITLSKTEMVYHKKSGVYECLDLPSLQLKDNT
jgi:hypothetical protein